MKILQINATCGSGSTGKICQSISQILFNNGIDNRIAYSLGKSDYQYAYHFSDKKSIKMSSFIEHIKGNWGFSAKKPTNNLIKYIEEYSPDIIHLHNIHSHDVNLEMLFRWIRDHNIKVFWTFHDCWAFTGYCTHFMMSKCDKWKLECSSCPQRNKYSWFFDRSCEIYRKKKSLFTGINLSVITPSYWLAEQVKKSFLQDCQVKVINNGIDLQIFKPTESTFRESYNITEKFILLGVAFNWDKSKGLDVFLELEKRLDSKKFQIVLVGTNEKVDKVLPKNIISIHKTQNQLELAGIYTAANLFVNPTREDTYPTVNMEAIACGTPVLTFKTGGSPEILDEFTGSVVECDDCATLEKEILKIYKERPYKKELCLKKAKKFNQNERIKEYIELLTCDNTL